MLTDQGNRSILRITLGLGGFVVILVGMYYMASFVNQVLLAAIITLLLVPLSDWLQKRGMSSTWANLLIVLMVLVAVIILGIVLVISLAGLVKDLPVYEQGIDETKAQMQSQLASMGIDDEAISGAMASASKQVLQIGATIAANLVGYVVNIFFVILIFAFMLFDVAGVRSRIQRAFSSDQPTIMRVHNSTTSVATYIRLLTFINLIIGVADTIFLWVLGIPNPVLWGFLAFITGYIPYIGFWIALIPVIILAYLQGGITLALIVLLGYWLINGTLSNIVAPRMYGKGLNLSPVVTLLAVLFWGAILGSVGAMIAVPLTAVLVTVVLISYPETEWLAIMMRGGDGSE